MAFFTKNKFLLAFLSFFILIASCSSLPKIPKPDWSKPIEPNARKRAQQNVQEGKGMQIFKGNKNNGNFSFASSNPMWRATLDILDFMSIANSDYAGGIIITDWYSEANPDEAIKINIRFLSNEIRPDGININLYKRTCNGLACVTNKIDDKLIFDLKDKILKKAAIYNEQSTKEFLKNRPKKVYKD
tara:strand:- start:242 stop:802 length:561 start_codon:yes stop_codon:yes gene_type:complete